MSELEMLGHEIIGHQTIALLSNHLWQSTVFAVVAALVTLAFRKNRAQVRYWVWLSASVKFLVPFALLMNLGNSLWSAFVARKIATELAPPAVSLTVQQIAQPFSGGLSFVPFAPHTHTADWIFIAILSAWICGFLGVVLVRLRSWLRVRAAVRASTPIDIQTAATVRSSPGLLEPGVVGVLRPVLLLPEDILKRLSASQLEAVLAHEVSHIKRHDNLTAAIHMVVESFFWFHPLVWWIGARLIEERERACDEAVLGLGGEPRDYADAIVSVCKLYVESPLACVPGISGADLKKRIVRIMACHVGLRMSVGRKLLLGAAGVLALAVPFAFGLMQQPSGQILHATGPLPSFEVATIKPNHSGSQMSQTGAAGNSAPMDRYMETNTTPKMLICWAFAGNSISLPSDQVSGGPDWIDSDRYDIDAKIEDSQAAALSKLSNTDRILQVRLMVQSLLADRFKLVANDTTVMRPVYALVVAKGGPKLQVTVPGSPRQAFFSRGEIRGHGIPISMLARSLSQNGGLDRHVLDETGLKGAYDIDLKWTPDIPGSPGMMPGSPPGTEPAPADTSGPSVLTAVQEQLGLKLEPTTGPVEAIEIVHIERPSPN